MLLEVIGKSGTTINPTSDLDSLWEKEEGMADTKTGEWGRK